MKKRGQEYETQGTWNAKSCNRKAHKEHKSAKEHKTQKMLQNVREHERKATWEHETWGIQEAKQRNTWFAKCMVKFKIIVNEFKRFACFIVKTNKLISERALYKCIEKF